MDVVTGFVCTRDKDIPWERKSYLTHAILPRTSSNVIMWYCILAIQGLLEAYFKLKKINKTVVSKKNNPLFM